MTTFLKKPDYQKWDDQTEKEKMDKLNTETTVHDWHLKARALIHSGLFCPLIGLTIAVILLASAVCCME